MNPKKKKKFKKKTKTLQGVDAGLEASDLSSRYSNFSREKFAEDITYLLRSSPESLKGSDAAAQHVVKTVLGTSEMAMEAEFEEVVFDPLPCVKTFLEVCREMEVNMETFGKLPKELAESIRHQLNEKTIEKVLDRSMREKILAGTEAFHRRKKRQKDAMGAARAAAVMLVLKEEKNGKIWPHIGLLHGIVKNSIQIGWELLDVLGKMKSPEADGQGGLESSEEAVSATNGRLGEFMAKNPRLQKFLDREIQKSFTMGYEALVLGNINLGLFTENEIDRASEVWAEAAAIERKLAEGRNDSAEPVFTVKTRNFIMSRLGAIVGEAVTPEKVEQAREKIDDFLKRKGDPEKHRVFIRSMREEMSKPGAEKRMKNFFVMALYGEASTAGGRVAESGGEQGDGIVSDDER